jgi:hypothetical protein
MKDEMRKELHHLLDKIIDDEKELGTIHTETQLPDGVKVEEFRLVLKKDEFEFPYPSLQ